MTAGDIVLLREERSRNKWRMGSVASIQKDSDNFVQSVNMVVGTNASKYVLVTNTGAICK